MLEAVIGHASDACEMVEWLLSHGAHVDGGQTLSNDKIDIKLSDVTAPLLLLACFQGNVEAIRLLLYLGASLNIRYCRLKTPLQATLRGKHEIVARLLLDNGALGSPIRAAASTGHTGLISCLLAEGANINVKGGCYASPLAAAISQKHSAVTALLLNLGADLNGGPQVSARLAPCSQFLISPLFVQ